MAWKGELDQIPKAAWKLARRRQRIIAPLADRDDVTESEVEQAGKALRLSMRMVFRLHRTVFRISQRLDYLPQSRPWPGDFDTRNRLGLLSHVAALAGGRSIRERLLLAPARRHSGMTQALSWLRSSERRTLQRRVAAWPQIQRNTVFSPD